MTRDHDPGLGKRGSPHPSPPSPLTQHRSCLMCPIELHSVTQDAVISGTDVRTFVETPGGGTGKAGLVWVGHVPTESVSADLTREVLYGHWAVFSLWCRRGVSGGHTHRPSLAKCCLSPPWPQGWRHVAERSLPRIAALQTESSYSNLREALFMTTVFITNGIWQNPF